MNIIIVNCDSFINSKIKQQQLIFKFHNNKNFFSYSNFDFLKNQNYIYFGYIGYYKNDIKYKIVIDNKFKIDLNIFFYKIKDFDIKLNLISKINPMKLNNIKLYNFGIKLDLI